MSRKLSRKQYAEQIGRVQVRLRELGFEIFRQQVPVWCVFEGWDAAGKGGAIKRVAEMLDPRGFTVSTYARSPGRGEDSSLPVLCLPLKAQKRAELAAKLTDLADVRVGTELEIGRAKDREVEPGNGR